MNNKPSRFTVYGKIRGKGRPRATTINGHAKLYTPEDTVKFESEIASAYQRAGGIKYDVPVMAYVIAKFAIPKSTTKKKKEQIARGGVFPTKKPDSDNILKAVLDGLNGVAYGDDSWVRVCIVEKRYIMPDENDQKERIEICIMPCVAGESDV